MKAIELNLLRHIKGDIFGGVTAAVVALPLALAFGLSSGAGATAGLYGAICVGFFAALFGGTPAQVSGPTGPMTVVMAAVFTQFSALDPERGPVLAFTVVILGGVFQVLFGVFKLGKFVTLMPLPVISGFMTGIGIIILILQLAPLLGHEAVGSVLDSLAVLPAQLDTLNPSTLLLGLLTLGIVFLCPTRIAHLIPAPLVALTLGTLGYLFFFNDVGVKVIGEIPSELPQLIWPDIELALLKDMLLAAMMLAALGSIDSLLTSLVADNISKTQHDSNRELIGQGIGNIAAGFFGGLPGAGATMRTVANIKAGGQTPLSGMTHALILLLVILGLAPLAENIPQTVLAAILIKVGIDIIDWKFLQRLHRAPLFVVILMFLVIVLTVFVDLVTAVLVGVFLANVITIKRLSDIQLDSIQVLVGNSTDKGHLNAHEYELLSKAAGRILLYKMEGPVSYASVKGITRILSHTEPYEVLMIDMTDVPSIDVSTAITIESIILQAQEVNRFVYLVGLNVVVEDVFERMQVLSNLPSGAIFSDREQALEAAYQRLSVSL